MHVFIIQEKEITYNGIRRVLEKGGITCTIGIKDKEKVLRFVFLNMYIYTVLILRILYSLY